MKSKHINSSPRNIFTGAPHSISIFVVQCRYASMYGDTSTFADGTAFLGIHRDSTFALQSLQPHVSEFENWLPMWKIKVSGSKCVPITSPLRRENCPPIKINRLTVPEHNSIKYLDRRLTWVHYIAARTTQLDWLIDKP